MGNHLADAGPLLVLICGSAHSKSRGVISVSGCLTCRQTTRVTEHNEPERYDLSACGESSCPSSGRGMIHSTCWGYRLCDRRFEGVSSPLGESTSARMEIQAASKIHIWRANAHIARLPITLDLPDSAFSRPDSSIPVPGLHGMLWRSHADGPKRGVSRSAMPVAISRTAAADPAFGNVTV